MFGQKKSMGRRMGEIRVLSIFLPTVLLGLILFGISGWTGSGIFNIFGAIVCLVACVELCFVLLLRHFGRK